MHSLVNAGCVIAISKANLVVMSEIIVWNGDMGRWHDCVNQTICAVRNGTMVHPDVPSCEDGNPISITYCSPPSMLWRIFYHSVSWRLTVVHVDAVNDDVCHILYGDTGAVSNVDVGASSIDCLETVHNELFLELDDHISLEDDPERFCLNHSMTQSAIGRIHCIITGIRNDIKLAVFASNGVTAKSNAAIRQPFSVALPIGVAAPTVIDGITRFAWQDAQISSSSRSVNSASASVRIHTSSIIVSIDFQILNKLTTERITKWNVMLKWAIYLLFNRLRRAVWIFSHRKHHSSYIVRCRCRPSHDVLSTHPSKWPGRRAMNAAE